MDNVGVTLDNVCQLICQEKALSQNANPAHFYSLSELAQPSMCFFYNMHVGSAGILLAIGH